jgi:hypothetical protein
MGRLGNRWAALGLMGWVASQASVCFGQPPAGTEEPVFRVSRSAAVAPNPKPHPLDPALDIAQESLERIRTEIHDYTAVVVKREEINGQLGEYEYMFGKFRNRRTAGGKLVTPFSVYLAFLKPAAVKGREVLFVENVNDGKMWAHEGSGVKKMLGTLSLEPAGALAMQGQRYPVTDIGIENLVLKLIEKGERDRSIGYCNVKFIQGAKVSGRTCTVLQVTHDRPVAGLDFHIARIFLDDELGIPVRYAAYDWPRKVGDEPPVIEEYTYQKIELNVGLTDKDFDPRNASYGFNIR